jgi:hypothetical protein
LLFTVVLSVNEVKFIWSVSVVGKVVFSTVTVLVKPLGIFTAVDSGTGDRMPHLGSGPTVLKSPRRFWKSQPSADTRVRRYRWDFQQKNKKLSSICIFFSFVRLTLPDRKF